MDAVTGRRVCELVMGIIATDSELHKDELAFMVKTFRTFGVATGADDEAITPATSTVEAAKAMRELPVEVQGEALDLLIASAAADGKVVEAERIYLNAVSSVVGVSQDELERRIIDKLAGD